MSSSVGGVLFFFSSRRRHTRLVSDWSSDVCSSDLLFIAQRQRRALDRLFADGGIAYRQQGKGGRVSLATVALRLHFAQDRQRGRVRDRAPFNHVAVAVGEQRLKRQFPELVVRRDDQARFTAERRLRRLQKEVVEMARRGVEPEVAPGELIAKTFGELRQFRSFDR